MDNTSHTFESVWAALQESNRFLTDKLDRIAENQAATDRLVKANAVQINGISANNGAAAEEFFYNALQYGNRKMFGEDFDDVFRGEKRKTNKGYEDEYDIMLFNGRAVCIVEVKYKADSNDVLQVLRKERTFRANFPEHNDKKLYLALASMSFHKLIEKVCKDNGIAIMKQAGESVVIHDENLKVF